MFEKLEAAKTMLGYLKGDPVPRLERAAIRRNKIINSDRYRRLIELRHSAPGEETVRDLNLFCNRLAAYENCCLAAQKIIRLTYNQAGGLYDSRAGGIERAVVGG